MDRKDMKFYLPMLGCDPEFFYVSKEGIPIPADKFLPGKNKKLTVGSENYEVGELFFDGFQAEINIKASDCRDIVMIYLRDCLRKAYYIGQTKREDIAEIKVIPTIQVTKELLEDAHPEARIFGCDPDFDAYNEGNINPPGPDAKTHMFRYSGGHIHIGDPVRTPKPEFMRSRTGRLDLVRLCDIIVGIPMVILDREEGSTTRRILYGRAGCFRMPEYGIEYRVPSNFWLRSPILASVVFDCAKMAFSIMANGLAEEFFGAVDVHAVRYAIDFNDLEVAKQLYNKIRNKLEKYTNRIHGIFHYDNIHYFDNIVEKGVGDLISNNMEEEWSINKSFTVDGFLTGMRERIKE